MAKELVNKGLDDLNWKIIEELQMNARITVVEIGKRIGLSAPAVAERIKKLEEVVVASTKELETIIEKLQEFGETSTSIILSGNTAPKIVKKI